MLGRFLLNVARPVCGAGEAEGAEDAEAEDEGAEDAAGAAGEDDDETCSATAPLLIQSPVKSGMDWLSESGDDEPVEVAE